MKSPKNKCTISTDSTNIQSNNKPKKQKVSELNNCPTQSDSSKSKTTAQNQPTFSTEVSDLQASLESFDKLLNIAQTSNDKDSSDKSSTATTTSTTNGNYHITTTTLSASKRSSSFLTSSNPKFINKKST